LPDPAATAARIRAWLFDQALPWWASHGLDRASGGYVESVDPAGQDLGAEFRRTRVTCRQIYVFSHAALMGFEPGRAAAAHGVDYLINRTWRADSGAFARRTSRSGALLDPTPDLYEHAFALHAFAWSHRAEGDTLSRDWAHRTLDAIEQHLRAPTGEGFLSEAPDPGGRRQNPHMHLAEAALAAFEATGEARFADLAGELVGLFRRRLFEPATGALFEVFEEDWSRAAGAAGRLVEPGHQFEWCWILASASRLLGLDTLAEVRALAAFAERHGVEPSTGRVFNAIREDGTVLDAASRTWPNTERLKAAVALHDLAGVDPGPVIAQSGGLLLDGYFGAARPGLWIDQLDAQGDPVPGPAPASTFYHIVLAFAETLRVAKAAGYS
jgi:mannose/cellobiose epimerase-like protein (N-acyl-D-glucosamine 2-epimerase family)